MGTVRRYEDWPIRYANALRERRDHPFTWGEHDCGAAICFLLRAIIPEDPYLPYKGYKTEKGANLRLARHGGTEQILEEVAARFEWEEVGRNFAQRGDLALVWTQDPNIFVPGLVNLDGMSIVYCPASVDDVGWQFAALESANRFWRVG